MRRQRDTLGGTLTQQIGDMEALGSTPAGRAWVMKAMNPSWPGSCVGMPDRTSSNIVMYNFDQTFLVEAPSSSAFNPADPWNYEINFHGHPICFADVIAHQQSAPNEKSTSMSILNSQLPDSPAYIASSTPSYGPTFWPAQVARETENYQYKTAEWQKLAQHARLCYAGFTLVQTASSNNDQGLLIAGQQPQTPRTTVVADTLNGEFIKQNYYAQDDFATFMNLTNLPRTMSGTSKDGAYSVMKLDEDYSEFKSQIEPVAIASHTIGTVSIPSGGGSGNGFTAMPHMFCTIQNGIRGIGMMDNFCPQILLRGIYSSTSFMVRCRMGFEIKPFAGATNSPFVMESPRYDPIALDMYSQLMLEVQMDAYPADYNLFEWLGKAIAKVAPYIKKALWGAAKGFIGSGGDPWAAARGAATGIVEQWTAAPELKRGEDVSSDGGAKTRRIEFVPQ